MNPMARQLREMADAIEAAHADPFEGILQEHGATREDWALFLCVKHPDWTVAELAEAAGVSERTLYRWPGVRQILVGKQIDKVRRYREDWPE